MAETQYTEIDGWTVIVRSDNRNRRRRTRRVDVDDVTRRAIARAVALRSDKLWTRIGCTVPNNYGYPAVTDAVTVLALWPERVAIVSATEIAANKATFGGAAAATLGEHARPVLDDRYGARRRDAARREVYAQTRAWLASADLPGCPAVSALRLDMHGVAVLREQLAEVTAQRDAEIARRRRETARSEDTTGSRWALLETT